MPNPHFEEARERIRGLRDQYQADHAAQYQVYERYMQHVLTLGIAGLDIAEPEALDTLIYHCVSMTAALFMSFPEPMQDICAVVDVHDAPEEIREALHDTFQHMLRGIYGEDADDN